MKIPKNLVKAIQENVLLTEEEKTQALADIGEMDSDCEYQGKTNFGFNDAHSYNLPAYRQLARLFYWEESKLGHSFWSKISDKIEEGEAVI